MSYRRSRYSVDDGRPRRRYRPMSRETARIIGDMVLATPETIRAQQAANAARLAAAAAPAPVVSRCHRCGDPVGQRTPRCDGACHVPPAPLPPTGNPSHCWACHAPVAPGATGCDRCHRSFLD
jgi:hypothetical protein